MPSPALSPSQAYAAMPQSPRQAVTAGNHAGGSAHPPLVKRHSSASSHGVSRQNITSPSSVNEHHPLRHPVGGRQRHMRLALPRNYSGGRNLAKLGKQSQQPVQQAEDGRKHIRQRSHEGDTEIRLPGSLDESRPPMRRNLTAYDLPRNASRAKLKKNLSHGQLTRLNPSSRNLTALNSATHKAPPSPGLKGKKKRPKSAEVVPRGKDLYEEGEELYREHLAKKAQQQPLKKVGFAVGGADDTSEGEDGPQMEGSGLQEDDWTDRSTSASPYSTRQNTASNSRRPSMGADNATENRVLQPLHPNGDGHTTQPAQNGESAEQPRPPETNGTAAHHEDDQNERNSRASAQGDKQDTRAESSNAESATQQPLQPKLQHGRSPLHAAKDHPNPTTKRLTSNQLPAPALVSSVSALDSVHNSSNGSPATSMRSSRSNVGGVDGIQDQDEDELVSRFMPSASHPSTGSSANNSGMMNMPKQDSFGSPEEESTLHRAKSTPFQVGPGSPLSTVSGSSGMTTPALGRSRIELRMMHDKALADREAAAERQPIVPHHVFDRRNETLKSYLGSASLRDDGGPGLHSANGLSLGPEIFQGRFKAINTELKVVQKFRDPIAEAVQRLRKCNGTRLSQRLPRKQAGLKTSKSAVSLPARTASSRESSSLSTSTSPNVSSVVEMARPKSPSKTPVPSAKSAVQINGGGSERRHPRRGVSFAGAPQMRDSEVDAAENDPDAIARSLWESVPA